MRRRADEAVNTSNYEFEETEPAPAPKRRTTKAVAARPTAFTVAGPYRYDTRFTVDDVSSSLYLDPLLGLGLKFRTRLSDVLENHRLDANAFVGFDLKSSNINASYTNLTKRYDWSIAYQKQAYFFDYAQGYRIRFSRNEIAPSIAYPLTHNISVRGGPRYDNLTRTVLNDVSTTGDLVQNYLGAQGEIVFDNTIVTGVNMLRGTRLKIGILRLGSLDSAKWSFGKLTIDLRHYQKISRSIIWANRVSYGQFHGAKPTIFSPRRHGQLSEHWLSKR